MSASSASVRALVARAAAHDRWARIPDRTAAMAVAKSKSPASLAYFEAQVDPENKLPASQRRAMAESARKAYFTRLALRSVQARQKK